MIMRHYFSKKNLSAYLDGELSQKRVQEIEAHLQRCVSCQRDLQEIREGKNATAYFSKPPWFHSQHLWTRIQRAKNPEYETPTVRVAATGWSRLFEPVVSFRPLFAAMLLVFLLAANLFVALNADKPHYQQAAVDWTPSYAFDYGLYLDALIQGEQPLEFEERYESRRANDDDLGSQITFRLASFSRLPRTFEFQEIRLLKNACCRSVQFVYSKNAAPVAVFQQPKGHPVSFGRYPLETLPLQGRRCHIIRAGRWKGLMWEGEDSQFVAIGEMNESEMATLLKAVTLN